MHYIQMITIIPSIKNPLFIPLKKIVFKTPVLLKLSKTTYLILT